MSRTFRRRRDRWRVRSCGCDAAVRRRLETADAPWIWRCHGLGRLAVPSSECPPWACAKGFGSAELPPGRPRCCGAVPDVAHHRARQDGAAGNAVATCPRWLWCNADDRQSPCYFFPALPTTPAWLEPPEREAGCGNGPSFAAGFVGQRLG